MSPKPAQGKALVLFSGGQDSTVCLASALARFGEVETVGFDYGQKHIVELECRTRVLAEIKAAFPNWAKKLGPDHMLNLRELSQISETSLTRDMQIEMDESGLPNTFVPGRNLLFFVYASALGYRRGAATLVGGMCETDYSGYPDCRNDTLQTLAQAVTLGMARPFTFDTPLMYIDKAETWALAKKLGGDALIDLIIEHTHTCYRGDRSHRHDWGYGCNDCPACELRANGFAKWQSAGA
jgi:7-cyano-7-deazaguanine synthase